MLRITDLTLSRGTKKLFDGANLTLPVGHKTGLIGANGCGKSTLFAAIRGEIAPDSGAIELPPKWKLAQGLRFPPALLFWTKPTTTLDPPPWFCPEASFAGFPGTLFLIRPTATSLDPAVRWTFIVKAPSWGVSAATTPSSGPGRPQG